ncbi:aspartyl-phosphate phosphatase Spo0E family protein [Paenibacillus albiflavus]|uniref:Aspartyl-phosphate phosphatase Spo0E family protein n=1 Tax=Paenibacillus albiflavus TaxID=2545760 RepID=A0A4R4E7Z5_9BACL|nr:aspartyl-phosphate phosphatase Spo0E family protein [Paenibacillus albiflavus]
MDNLSNIKQKIEQKRKELYQAVIEYGFEMTGAMNKELNSTQLKSSTWRFLFRCCFDIDRGNSNLFTQ